MYKIIVASLRSNIELKIEANSEEEAIDKAVQKCIACKLQLPNLTYIKNWVKVYKV